MMKILLATTVLAASAGLAAAEVTLSGSARMGVVNRYVAVDDSGAGANAAAFSSRARVDFALSGETDGGLGFGAAFRADQAGAATGGTAMDGGTVFVSGAFGKLTMGDNDTAANSVIGQVDGVGYTGNGDWNEIAYLGQTDSSVLYSYGAGDLTFAASLGQVAQGAAEQEYSVAVAYALGGYRLMAGYEKGLATVYSYTSKANAYAAANTDLNDDLSAGGESWYDPYAIDSHLVLGADAVFGAVSVKGRVGMGSGTVYGDQDTFDATQYAVSATYRADALSLTAFAARFETAGSYPYRMETVRMGVGAAYDLGGGAVLSAGYSSFNEKLTGDGAVTADWDDDRYEAGVTFSF